MGKLHPGKREEVFAVSALPLEGSGSPVKATHICQKPYKLERPGQVRRYVGGLRVSPIPSGRPYKLRLEVFMVGAVGFEPTNNAF